MVLTTRCTASVTREMALVKSDKTTPAMMETHSFTPYLRMVMMMMIMMMMMMMLMMMMHLLHKDILILIMVIVTSFPPRRVYGEPPCKGAASLQ